MKCPGLGKPIGGCFGSEWRKTNDVLNHLTIPGVKQGQWRKTRVIICLLIRRDDHWNLISREHINNNKPHWEPNTFSTLKEDLHTTVLQQEHLCRRCEIWQEIWVFSNPPPPPLLPSCSSCGNPSRDNWTRHSLTDWLNSPLTTFSRTGDQEKLSLLNRRQGEAEDTDSGTLSPGGRSSLPSPSQLAWTVCNELFCWADIAPLLHIAWSWILASFSSLSSLASPAE